MRFKNIFNYEFYYILPETSAVKVLHLLDTTDNRSYCSSYSFSKYLSASYGQHCAQKSMILS